jgi:hypothetical protein
MSLRQPDFAAEVAAVIKKYPFKGSTAINNELALITAALATDVTTHSKVIEAPPTALNVHYEANTPFSDAINLIVNKGKAGNLTVVQMLAGIDDGIGLAHKPAHVDIPYASATATPPIVGTVCNVTTGNWVGIPTSYTYQWKRDGVTNIGTTNSATAPYTLIAADIGGHLITCVVTATNASGSTAAPPSNAILT